MTPDALLALFRDVAGAIRDAVAKVEGTDRRARTEVPGQYAIDLVADAAALDLLAAAPVRVVSEESGASGAEDAAITIVMDPVDGSTNASRHLPYWATSLCAVDESGMLAALVVNQATETESTATRGGGAHRDGERVQSSLVTRLDEAFVSASGIPTPRPPWKQCRVMGSCALSLCDVAAGRFDGYLDLASVHAPWDYLGGALVCAEAGAVVVDATGEALVTDDPSARRHLVAAGTRSLADALCALVV